MGGSGPTHRIDLDFRNLLMSVELRSATAIETDNYNLMSLPGQMSGALERFVIPHLGYFRMILNKYLKKGSPREMS